jgi:hypothetical protein
MARTDLWILVISQFAIICCRNTDTRNNCSIYANRTFRCFVLELQKIHNVSRNCNTDLKESNGIIDRVALLDAS